MAESEQSTDIWILCYGSNGPRQLGNRIGKPYEEIIDRMCAVKLRGYIRAFCGVGPRWDNASVATLLRTDNNEDAVEGIALRMTQEEVTRLDVFEGYPDWYNREDVVLEVA